MVAAHSKLTVIPYERRYRAQMFDLLDYSFQRHLHFDWYEPEEWIESGGGVMRLAFRGTHMVGMMGATFPADGMSWLRMAVVADGADEAEVLEKLWPPLKNGLRDAGAQSVWLLTLEPWFEYFMPLLEMTEGERLVTLRRESEDLPDIQTPDVRVALATLDDVAALAAIDQAAFKPPFPMTVQEMRRAYRFAALSSVARLDGTIAGYQLSTRHEQQGHLARLAVDPARQGQGVGVALVQDMIAGFLRRGVSQITVNTQITNERSLRVYAACGFERSGYDIPIYRAML